MLHFILQTIAFQLFFLIIYDAFLKKETFFNWNRAYLLVTAILSVLLPFIKIQSFKNVVPKEFVVAMPEVIIGNAQGINTKQAVEIIASESSKFQWSWEFVFYIGASTALIIFMVKLFKIATLIYKNPKYWSNNLRIVTLLKSNLAFSFFYYVFLGEQIKEADKPAILKHEAVHVNQKHTLDLLFFELFRIVFWFNPLIYMYQNRIASLHEFIADAEAVKSQGKNEYYQDLLSQIFETKNVSFINAFYKKSLIKKRIVMLTKAKSKQVQLIKYALLIPLVFGMLLYTSSYAQDSTSKGEEITQEMTDEELENMYYQQLVEIKNKNLSLYPYGTNFITKKDNYIVTRQEHFKARAFFRFLKENRIKQLKEDGIYEEEDSLAYITLLNKYKSYADYLAYKKTDEAKRAWDNQTREGVLRLVVDDIGNFTDQEKALFDKKMKMIDDDEYFKKLLIVSVDGRAKTLIKSEPKTNGFNKKQGEQITEVKETQTQNPIEVPFATIEEIPMLSTCISKVAQDERKDCVTKEISKHVQDNFNVKLAGKLGLSGKQRISVIFKIDTNGNVFGVRSRAPHPDLEAEAIRVINTLPQFTPGKQNGEKVIVPYSLPIIFEVKDETDKKGNEIPKDKSETLKVIEKQDLSDLVEVPFATIDEVPVYPGCENITDIEEQRKCMADKISEFVQKNFNTDLAKQKELSGRQRINVVFKIDTLGNITGIRSRAAHPNLKTEAERVIGLLPKMQPGKHKGEKVIVPYSLPIIFEVAEKANKTEENKKADDGKIEEKIEELKNLTISEINENGLPFAIVDKVPMFPECQSLSTQDEQKKCVSDEIIKIVQKNFNTDLASKLNLKGQQRIMIVFIINENGTALVDKVRAPHPELESEAKRVIELLPKFTPGEHKGKKVNVSYSLPITFMVK